MVYCFPTVRKVKFLQLSFVIFVGEELTEFVFVREECEKNFENHWSGPFIQTFIRAFRVTVHQAADFVAWF